MENVKFPKRGKSKHSGVKSKGKSEKKPTIKLHSDIYRRYYSRWKEFKKMPKYDLDKPSVLNSGPYLGGKGMKFPSSNSDFHLENQQKDHKEKWVGKKDFKTFFGRKSSKESANYIPNYVSKAPSNPPMLHKFREVERKKWVGAKNFYV